MGHDGVSQGTDCKSVGIDFGSMNSVSKIEEDDNLMLLSMVPGASWFAVAIWREIIAVQEPRWTLLWAMFARISNEGLQVL